MKQRIEAEAERMRERSQISPGSGGWQRRRTARTPEAQKQAKVLQQRQNREAIRERERIPKPIHPMIAAVPADELVEAGWGDVDRWKIPLDWRKQSKSVTIR